MLAGIVGLDWSVILQIVAIDMVLSGDNAIIIALACRNLSARQRKRSVLFGTAGAVLLRVLLAFFALALLELPLLKILGGLLLLWIGIKLILPAHDAHRRIQPANQLTTAIKTIIVADFVMSLDNVIGLVGAAQAAAPEARLPLIAFGLLLSIPIIISASQLLLKLIDRFPIIVPVSAALLGWIAGGLIIKDPFVQHINVLTTPAAAIIASAASAALVVALGTLIKQRRQVLHKD